MDEENQNTPLITDDHSEVFTESECHCLFCYETRRLGLEFNHYEPTTHLQKRMKRVIEKLESKYK